MNNFKYSDATQKKIKIIYINVKSQIPVCATNSEHSLFCKA
jgi:hypothetical protein